MARNGHGSFSGRTVIVTGGTSGIGLATATAFAAQGAHVAVVARDAAKLGAAQESLELARVDESQRVTTRSADMCDYDAAEAAFLSLSAEGFSPDILINSVGVILPGEFATMPLERVRLNMDSGFHGVVHPCRAAVPGMIERGSGHIVNVSSVAGFLGIYGYTGYSAAKYAVMGFTEALRFEMKPHGVNVSVVCPPDTDTPALTAEKTMRPAETSAIAGNIAAISPQRVAESIVKGVERGRYLIIPDAQSRFYFRLKGLWPEVFHAIVDSDVRKARKGT